MPFYLKSGDNWIEVKQPVDVRHQGKVLCSVCPSANVGSPGIADPGKMVVAVPAEAEVVVTEEGGGKIFPGQEREINRRDIFIQDLNTGTIRAVIHSEEEIG